MVLILVDHIKKYYIKHVIMDLVGFEPTTF